MLLKQKVIVNTKDVSLNRKHLRHSINRIESKDHRIGTYKSTIFLCLGLMIK